MLEALGLDAASETVYRSMLAHPGLGVAALAERLNLSEQQVRAGLDRLAELALLRPSRERPGQVQAVHPELGLAALVRRQQSDLLRRQQEVLASQDALTELIAAHRAATRTHPDTAMRQLIGLDAVQSRLEALAQQATTECLSIMPGGAQSAETLDGCRELDRHALQRGVAIKTLYQDSVRNDTATRAYARWLTACGGQVRTQPLLPVRMVLVDRQTALIPLCPDDSSLGALNVTVPSIVAALVALFRHIWDTATPLDGPQPTGDPLTGQERRLLLLLADGLTDEAAANRLAVSLRTVRRMTAHLMATLDAQSRFEAGSKATKRGWI
ncbi:LuxR C-terminal-related transcriptional regulator [Actinomadura harenae]|uniref:Helix-turn-helix transcriptional regulator n=1 Tax=Actinomadura harenae TaxID=2483351 RepID=A0A3M2LZZ1_9ACTN|nr:LuxR C-terminal-related transcriptional regulator [Actinomadura harenae]RMI42420.1 helix-turn-helix transcriptional regulator [Actinomadura harenae]